MIRVIGQRYNRILVDYRAQPPARVQCPPFRVGSLIFMNELSVPVSYGELIDKITILEIKAAQIRDAAKLANVRTELDLLNATWAAHPAHS